MNLTAFGVLCAAAQQHGSGTIEITARGSIQVRGLTAASAPRFAETIAALRIAAAGGVAVFADPLAGLDAGEILDAGALVAELQQRLLGTSLAARLAPKVSVLIDGGGALGLDFLSTDIRLCAEVTGDRSLGLGVAIGGDAASATQLGAISVACCVDAGVRLLEVIARYGRKARARDVLAADGAGPFRAAISDLLLPERDRRVRGNGRTTEAIGAHRIRGRLLAYGIGLAFGHADAARLQRLTEAARAAGASGLRAAAGRALLIIALNRESLPAFVAAAERLGFVVDARDPRRNVIACAGAPMCSSAHIATRLLAPGIAAAVAPHIGRALAIHVSGCAKGCAHPAPAALTIVGSPEGCSIIANGTARDMPFMRVASAELTERIVTHVRCRKGGGFDG